MLSPTARAFRNGRSYLLLLLFLLLVIQLIVFSTLQQKDARKFPWVSVTSKPVDPEFFGMHTQGFEDWPTVPFGSLGKGTLIGWPYIEKSKGVRDWSTLDRWVNAAQSNGKSFLYNIGGIPPWAAASTSNCAPLSAPGASQCNSMVKNIEDWDNFVTALVTRYEGKLIYELWNEPNTKPYSNIGPTNIALLCKHAHNIIRRVDPDALIVGPPASPRYLDKLFSAGLPTDLDVVSFHAYHNVAEEVVPDIIAQERIMAKYGLFSKPLWNTEGSWGLEQFYGTPDDTVGFVARYNLLHWSEGVSRLYWYSWNNNGWGLLKGTPAATAYFETYKWMVGATINQRCADNNGIWTCRFTRSGGYWGLAVWSTSGAKDYVPTTEYKQYRDLAGNKVAIAAGQSVQIGIRPILLESSTPVTTTAVTTAITPSNG